MNTNLQIQSPLFQPIMLNGQVYFTSQHFHQEYRQNSDDGGKYEKLKNFNALVRSIEAYQDYVDNQDIVELQPTGLNSQPVITELFRLTRQQPIMLINGIGNADLAFLFKSNSYNPLQLCKQP